MSRVLFLALLGLAMGCNHCKKKEAPAADAGAAAVRLPPPPPGAPTGSIRGSVSFLGTPPEMPLLNRANDSFCARTQARDEEVIVNANRTLRNVVLRIVEGVPYSYPVPTTPIEVKQVNCIYIPRVQTGVVGQELVVYNNDPILHNVNTVRGTAQWFNQPQPALAGLPPIKKKLVNGVGRITFKCDIHPWMRAHIAMASHPFSAVTAADGTFRIGGVPPGNYTVEAWHERYGSKKAQVKVEANQVAEASFSFGG